MHRTGCVNGKKTVPVSKYHSLTDSSLLLQNFKPGIVVDVQYDGTRRLSVRCVAHDRRWILLFNPVQCGCTKWIDLNGTICSQKNIVKISGVP